ncbi:MAG: sulfatase [Kiritimatiellales bacterium]
MQKNLMKCAAVCTSIAAGCIPAAQEKPNILFILVDDLGWNDVQFLPDSTSPYSTPNIRQLARQGMVFTDAYAASPVCSPTRASLLTGKSPAALRLTSHIPRTLDGNWARIPDNATMMPAEFRDRLPLPEITFAELLKKDGYRTGFFGKWHLAGQNALAYPEAQGVMLPDYHPDRQGFDINIGGASVGAPPTYISPYGLGMIRSGPEGEYLTDRLTNEVMDYIKTSGENPFLAYLCYYSVHRPHHPRPDLVDSSYGALANYAAMIAAVDENIGRLMKFLDESGLTENTLLIVTSDNGGLEGNLPLRGVKGSLWEGGIRVPTLVRWPGVIRPGSVCNEPVISYDFLPTLLAITGSDQPVPNDVEGVSLLPLFTGSDFKRSEPLYWHFPHYHNDGMSTAIRDGKWKLIYSYVTEEMFLFDLEDDFREQRNLAAQFPEKAEQLKTKLFRWLKEVDALMPVRAVDTDKKS